MFVFYKLALSHASWSIKQEDEVHCLLCAFCWHKKIMQLSNQRRVMLLTLHLHSDALYLGIQAWNWRLAPVYPSGCNIHCLGRNCHYIRGPNWGCKPWKWAKQKKKKIRLNYFAPSFCKRERDVSCGCACWGLRFSYCKLGMQRVFSQRQAKVLDKHCWVFDRNFCNNKIST